MYNTWYIFSSLSIYLNSYIMPAPTALWGRLLELLFIFSSVLCLARDWDRPNMVPSKSLEGFDESTSSSSWINRAVAFTCSEEGKVLPWTCNQLPEVSLSQVKDLDSKKIKSLHMTCGFSVWLLMLWFQGTWLSVKLRQWYYLSLKYIPLHFIFILISHLDIAGLRM